VKGRENSSLEEVKKANLKCWGGLGGGGGGRKERVDGGSQSSSGGKHL